VNNKINKYTNLSLRVRLNVPQPALIHEDSDVKLPFVSVGDQAFSLTDKVLRLYKGIF
jgi:hypothetical protein